MRFLWLMFVGLQLGAPAAAQSNVLLLIADDVGVDTVAVYGEHPVPANTPNIDLMAARGVLFRRATSNPSCSPTRATILSGNYAWRTGMGTVIDASEFSGMELSRFTTLPGALGSANYTSALLGKWHLGKSYAHPLLGGFDEVRATPGNLRDYYQYFKNVNGEATISTTYATTDTVDDALDLMLTLPEPWFIWVGFHAAHLPYHAPPEELHTVELPGTIAGNEPVYSRAIIEAMDTEIGRLLNGVDPAETTVVFVGDNGPEGVAVLPPWTEEHAKTTLYEQGIRVPLIVTGPGVVQGAECTALVNTTDLYATIADLAGADSTSALDSVSLRPYLSNPDAPSQRAFAFEELFQPNFLPSKGPPPSYVRRGTAVRGNRYKLIHSYAGPNPVPVFRELYDLLLDPLEAVNLLDSPLSLELKGIYTDLQVQLVAHGPSPWATLAGGVPGTKGIPNLQGVGSLVTGTPVLLKVNRAAANASVSLFVGLSVAATPFLCGVLFPAMDAVFAANTNAEGVVSFGTSWPVVPPATQVAFQAWVQDPVSECGYSASNGLVATSAP